MNYANPVNLKGDSTRAKQIILPNNSIDAASMSAAGRWRTSLPWSM